MTDAVKTLHCETVEKLLQNLLELCNPSVDCGEPVNVWIFRGQSNAAWPLVSTLERDQSLTPLWESESVMLNEFRAKAHLYSDLLRRNLTTVDVLSIMQHNGAPTRLLDWTYSPSVAAFFAAVDTTSSSSGKAAVWAVNDSKVRWWSNRTYLTRFGQEIIDTDVNFLVETREIDFSKEEEFSTLRLRESIDGFIERGFIASLLPSVHHPRLVSQQGVFLANFNLDIPFQQSLESMLENADEPAIQKFEFPISIRDQLLRRLITANVHEGVLFPDLYGLCKFIRTHRMLYPHGSLYHTNR